MNNLKTTYSENVIMKYFYILFTRLQLSGNSANVICILLMLGGLAHGFTAGLFSGSLLLRGITCPPHFYYISLAVHGPSLPSYCQIKSHVQSTGKSENLESLMELICLRCSRTLWAILLKNSSEIDNS